MICSDVGFFSGALLEQQAGLHTLLQRPNSFRAWTIVGARFAKFNFTGALLEQIGE
jgi:hypothetical protein